MKKIIIGLAVFLFSAMLYEVKAGPPKNATKHMVPFPVICTPTMTEMMGALTKDYAVHISMIFEESPTTGIVVVHNPDTQSAAVLHTSAKRTCVVFSGRHLQMFDRPGGMAPPEEQVPQDFEEL